MWLACAVYLVIGIPVGAYLAWHQRTLASTVGMFAAGLFGWGLFALINLYLFLGLLLGWFDDA